MSADLTALVLLAALMHATWSALAYRFSDQAAGFTMLLWATVPMALTLVVLAPAPDAGSLPYLVASVVLHIVYTLGLVRANQVAQFSQLYPISRGLAPVIVAVAVLSDWAGVDEDLSIRQLVAIMMVLVGLLLLASTRVHAQARRAGPILAAVLIAAAIASYTVVDGAGVRKAGSVLGYFGWLSLGLSLGSALLLSSRADVRRRIRAAPRLWWRAVTGACLSSGAYGLVIWAQAHGSISVVAALRETSVVFATVIAVCLFDEGWGARRIVAAAAVVAGLAILHVG